MLAKTSEDVQNQIVNVVKDFIKKDVDPIASTYEQEDIYPHELIPTMKELGLFGITIPEEYGGMGLDFTTFAKIFEEISKGWMSLSGIIGTHHILSHVISNYGTDEQKNRILPKMATGEIRGALALTEPEAGSDTQNISTVAVKDGEEYVINGRKMYISNGEHGNAFALMAKTDPDASPKHRGISCFIFEKPTEGFKVGQHLDKLGYRGIDTCELIFDNCRVPADNLIGGVEGKGFGQVMNGLETGRINVAARAVGVAQAALDAAVSYAQQRKTFGQPISQHQAIQLKLADMATKVHAARLMVYDAAAKKDSGLRNDMEASMAKLFASEVCGEVAMEAMRVHGGAGYIKDLPVERYYRDAPLMIIGEGTNEIMKLLIARRILERNKI
ncbi:MAG: acyl-CoA dehydrogenase [Chloroflexi bacterium]|nr:acyl-CoA dehydrogenase [Chloroflexota bacterium]MBA14674.1 acyl-CoA dehydrogenase [Chloroflexota bacterium]MBG55296.1 acyl-CoA dehydrogenase [Chloroflexota bacterium]MBR48711.1 acyl-CoA dehydrogenase [Chloroflexota bacterium]|tara:strand:+ start:1003 stop:2163 length:1161 start_codon:yes stop_codon:yes gene_type:complete